MSEVHHRLEFPDRANPDPATRHESHRADRVNALARQHRTEQHACHRWRVPLCHILMVTASIWRYSQGDEGLSKMLWLRP